MSSDTAIRVTGLGKRYRIGERERYKALRDVITDAAASPFRKLRNAVSGRRQASNGNGNEATSLTASPLPLSPDPAYLGSPTSADSQSAIRNSQSDVSSLITHDSSLVRDDSASPLPLAEPADTFWALRNVSFEVKPGEVVGIIGRNGAGKSTLLKILSRITAPTEGEVEVKGRVGSLLEVGTGFHPELTGRENIYLNGAILGMKRAEINRKFDEIVAFAEIEKFIDTPVKRYSSGMYVRLAFAVAAHLEPEILVVDEVLAVGDAAFQKKCLGKMGDVAKEGRTVLFVSHNMNAINSLCGRGLLVDCSRLLTDDVTQNVIRKYLGLAKPLVTFAPRPSHRLGDGQVQIENFTVEPKNPTTGQPVRFVFKLSGSNARVEVAVSVLTDQGNRVMQIFSRDMGQSFPISGAACELEVALESLPLMPGEYWLNLWVGSGTIPYDWIRDGYCLTVAPGGFSEGHAVDYRGYPVVVPSQWQFR